MTLSPAGESDINAAVVTDSWGIDDRYVDVAGEVHALPPATREALLRAMRVPSNAERGPAPGGQPGTFADVVVLRGERGWEAAADGQLLLEDGARRAVRKGERVELPLGYHEHTPQDGAGPVRLIVAPAHCHEQEHTRIWGWAAQLYATRSRQSWGIGDLADLRRLAAWSRALGAEALMINPLTAPTPVLPLEPSPYYPSSRRYRNPIYLRVDELPGADQLGDVLDRLATAGRGLNARREIDRDAVFALKTTAFEACFARFEGDPAFDEYQAQQGRALVDFAIFCAIAERHGKDWRQWPEELRRPDGPAVAAFAERRAARVTYHAWLQWLLDGQLARASREVRIIQDLPIGLDVAGADAWCWQDLLAEGVSVGAPPDQFNPRGQDWGLTPFIPHKLRAAGYQPLIETIRATIRHAGGLRIDHVMGLFHLYWIPKEGGGPTDGGFVRTRADELLAIIALESERAQAFVVGEDLGTVEPGVREKMADHRMLSYRLMYFESVPPAQYPELALSAVTTHDLATVTGLMTGADLRRAQAAGAPQNEEEVRALRDKVIRVAEIPADSAPAEVVERVYEALAAAPSRVLLVTLDDALVVAERPNIPGARADWPNWSTALPQALEELESLALPRRLAQLMNRRPTAPGGGHEPDPRQPARPPG
ncbi:MAG TPA: 4-alpha-glucanotransferase [Polyangia bacterium]